MEASIRAIASSIDMHVGTMGMAGLVAYTGVGIVADLLRRPRQPGETIARRLQEVQGPTSLSGATTTPTDGYMETVQ